MPQRTSNAAQHITIGVLGTLMILTTLQPMMVNGQTAIPQQRDAAAPTFVQSWELVFTQHNGFLGLHEFVSLASDGKVRTRPGGPALLRASAQQLTEVRRLIDRLELSTVDPSMPPPASDWLIPSMKLTRGGQTHFVIETGAYGSLFVILDSLRREGEKRAEDQMWRKAGPLRLGRGWHVREEVHNSADTSESFEATWTRRGETRIFDAVWRTRETKRVFRDTVRVETAARGTVVLHRSNGKIHYAARYYLQNPKELVGVVDPCGCQFFADIEY